MTEISTHSQQKSSSKSKWSDTLIALTCTLPIYAPLLKTHFFWSHENAYFLWRLASLHQNVVNGLPLCRWFPDFARGFGLPFLEFYPALPLYLSEIFRFPGIPVILSVKLTIVVMTLFAALGALKLGTAVWGRTGGILTSVLYSYAPYKMLNLYVRGDINEYMAMASLPWALWIIYKSAVTEKQHNISLTSIAVFSIPALCHYPSCIIQYPVLFIWFVALLPSAINRKKYFLRNSINFLLALSITSTYWVSAFFSRHLVQMEGMTQGFADYTKHFIDLSQLISFYWNFGASVLGPGDAISFQIGNFALMAMLVGSPLLVRVFLRSNTQGRAVQTATGLLIFGVFLLNSTSQWIWSNIPLLPILQFPYRILVVPALMIALMGGSCGAMLENRKNRWKSTIVFLMIIAIITGSFYMCRVAEYMELTSEDLDPADIRLAAHTHCTGEYIPKPVGKRFPPLKPVTFTLHKIPEHGFSREQTEARLAQWLESASKVETWEGGLIPIGPVIVEPGKADVVQGNITLSNQTGPLINRSWTVEAKSPGKIRINQFYFQGWSARLDNENISLQPDTSTGLIHIEIPKGNHELNLKYRNLPLSRYFAWIGTIILIFTLMFYFRTARKHENGR
ncbi:hypothetical protein K8T06_07425 [bacterium]|nr:hypothetical protein [bacterium]